MPGLHLLADFSGCAASLPEMSDPDALRRSCLAAALGAGLQVVGDAFHAFAPEHGEPRGVTGVLLLAESHLAVHTWPELGAATLDIYVCNFSQDNSAAARAACQRLIAAFAPERIEQREVMRGGVYGAL